MSHKIKLHHSELNYRKYRNSPQSKKYRQKQATFRKISTFSHFLQFFPQQGIDKPHFLWYNIRKLKANKHKVRLL